MKRFLVILWAMILIFGIVGNAGAVWVTYYFDPNDWVTNFSPNNANFTETRIQQDNPRLYINGVSETTDVVPGIHTTYAGSPYSSTGIEGYANQIPNVEIHDFNMWLADGINAPNWGEVLTQVAGSVPSGTAANGWSAYVFDNPWPQLGYGDKLVGWYDVGYWDGDPSTPPNPLTFGSSGIDFDVFTLTVDLNPTDVYGNSVDFSAPQRIWLGALLPVQWTDNPNDLVYTGNYRFEGTMNMNPVPEPASMLLLGTGLIGLAVIGRKRGKGGERL